MLLLQVGDKVKKGQVLCILEAMKMMNEIEVCVFTFLFVLVYYYIFFSFYYVVYFMFSCSTIQKSVIQKSCS